MQLNSLHHTLYRWSVLFSLVMGILLISGCSPLNSALTDALTGDGGPTVNTNVGREVNDTLASVGAEDRSVSVGRNSQVTVTETTETVRTDSAENITVNNTPPWIIIVLVVGSVLLGSLLDDVIRTIWRKVWN